MKWKIVDEDEGERIYRACPFCLRRLLWRYDTERDFTIGVPRCTAHGDLNAWVITDGEQYWGIGQLTDPGIILDIPCPAFDIEYDSHRFKAVAPKRNLRVTGALLEQMEVDDERVH
jgi:hypothetical protein